MKVDKRIRRTAAALAVSGVVALPLAACGGVDYAAESSRVASQHSSYMAGKPPMTLPSWWGPAPESWTKTTSAAPKTSSATQSQAQQPGKKSDNSIPVWVWILGGGAVLFVGYRFLQHGSGQAPAHAACGPSSVPQQVLDYTDYTDYDDEPVSPAPPAPPVAPAAPPSGGSSNDLWGA